MFVSDKYEGKGHKNKAELVLLFPVLFSTVRSSEIYHVILVAQILVEGL